MSGALFVVATPIGHLGDISERALQTLRTCDRVLAEDTRRTRQLLTHFGIGGRSLERLDEHASARAIARVIERLSAGERIALVSDAGTPGVSDPGERLVEAAIAAGVAVIPIPGASAVLASLAGSGLARTGEGFRFVGFLPRAGGARRNAIAVVCETPEPVVLFESPKRAKATLRDLAEATPERRACVARELTKVHEEFVRGSLRELAGDPREWTGELCIVLGGHDPRRREEEVDDAHLDERIDEGLAQGLHLRTIAETLAAWSGRPRREVYARVVARKSGTDSVK